MRFFSRKTSEPDFLGFWQWWSSAREAITNAIDDGTLAAQVEPISRTVHALHPKLAWELAKGAASRHAFCVSPEGDPEVRVIALAWIDSAPAPDAIWEYHPSRQPGPLGTLGIGSVDFDLSAMRAQTQIDETRRRIDVALWHPAFADVPVEARHTTMFLFLDTLLGEDDVERWIGRVDEAPGDGTAGRDPAELVSVIDQIRTLPDEEVWVLAQATDRSGGHGVFLTNPAIKRIDHPFADHHLCVTVPLNGMPSEDESAVLNAAEDALVAELPVGAVYFGRETWPNRRRIHFATADTSAVRAAVASWIGNGHLPEAKVEWKHDPRWTFRADLP